ncbi:MAG: T9SS type A sorting domain-containing protein [Bacteroidia bacterium]|nr:T9SS type A sorting domain-containing protein [Bacteroidia bacterium]
MPKTNFYSEKLTEKAYDIFPAINAEKKHKLTPEERARFTQERFQFEFDMLKDPATGQIPEGIRQLELSQAYRAPVQNPSQRSAAFSVTERGPNNLGGRTRAITFDTRYASNTTILAGGVSSGVFRTTNGGTTWTKVSSDDEIHNVTAIAQDTRSGQEDIWYYATGEAIGNSASLGSSYYGTGIWKSTDNGTTWTFLGNSNTGSLVSFDECADFISKLVVDPTNGDVYAAALGEILRSQDGGTNWSSVLGPGCSSTSNVTDLVVTSTGRLYAAFSGVLASTIDGVWTSTTGDFGDWTRIAGDGTPGTWSTSGNYGRVVLAIAPSDEDILYALYDNDFSSACAGTAGVEADLFQWDQGTTTWTDLTANLPDETGCSNGNDPFAIQGGYDLVVAVKPDNASTVFVGGTNIYRSTDGFTSTSNTTRIGGYANTSGYAKYTNHHPDIHVLTFAPNNNDVLYSGTDGGIHSADITAGTPAWTSLNNDYVTYQYYHVAIDPTVSSDYVIGGAQDNGTTESSSGTSHTEIGSGDGVAVGIATSGENYFGSQNGALYRDGSTITPSGASASIFVTYFLLDPDNTEILYYAGGTELYRTTSASTVASGSWTEMTGVQATVGGNVRSLAVTRGSGYGSTDAGRVLYIGTQVGEVFRLNDPAFGAAATAPTDITPGTAGVGVVSSIAVNPNDDNEILVTYSNYGINSVYHTTDANSATPTWSLVEGNISTTSFRSASILEEGGITYYIVGTSIGLYCTSTLNAGSTTWTRIGSTSIGYALTSSLALRATDNFLLAGTHGNGMFMVEPPRDPEIYFTTTTSSTTETTTTSVSCRDYTDITVEMSIAAAPTGDATVTINLSGTATEGSDYDILNASNQLTFPDGSVATQDVDLRIYDESGDESAETIILNFVVSGVTDAVGAAYNQTHTLTLNDNDTGPAASFTLFTEDFETALSYGSLGSSNWSRGLFGGSGFNYWFDGTNGGMTGSGSAYVSDDGVNPTYDNTAAEDPLISTPQIDATAYAGQEITFDFKCNGESGADYGRLYYSLNGTTFFLIEGTTTAPYVGVTTATTRTVTLPAAVDNTTYFIGWRWTNNANSVGSDPAFVIDNIDVHTTGGTGIETVLNATDEQYFGPFETVHFYDGTDVVVSLTNNSAYDYGCTSVTVDRAGSGAQPAWSLTAGHELADKTFLITPTNNSPGGGDSYDITLYYTDTEFDGWVANSNLAYTTSDFKMVKSVGPISGLSPANQNATLNSSVTYGALGDNHTFTATFTGGFSGFGGGNPSSPLPVELLSFTGEEKKGAVDLTWRTAWELNNDRFEVEKSADGKAFTKIGQVKGMGYSQQPVKYSFNDPQPFSGVNFYRLRQIDFDGRFDYSNIIQVWVLGENTVSVTPNPFTDFLRIEMYAGERKESTFKLFASDGKLILSRNWIYEGKLKETVPLPVLPRGIYIYQIENQGKTFGGKLIRD